MNPAAENWQSKTNQKTPNHKMDEKVLEKIVTCQYWVHCQAIVKICMCAHVLRGYDVKNGLRNNLKKKN